MWKVFSRRKNETQPVTPREWTKDLIENLFDPTSTPDRIDKFRWAFKSFYLEQLATNHEIKCDRCHNFEPQDASPYWSTSETHASGAIKLDDGRLLRANFEIKVDENWVRLYEGSNLGWPGKVESMGALMLTWQDYSREICLGGLLHLRPKAVEALYRALQRATDRGQPLLVTLKIKIPPDIESLPPEKLMWARPLITGFDFQDFCGAVQRLKS